MKQIISESGGQAGSVSTLTDEVRQQAVAMVESACSVPRLPAMSGCTPATLSRIAAAAGPGLRWSATCPPGVCKNA